MSVMRRRITIDYHWRCNDFDEILERHIEALEETAEERIRDMMKQGYLMGELHDDIRMTDEDGDEGVSYSGWWGSKTEVIYE